MKLDFADNLKRFRRERELTREALAAVLGISPQAVGRYVTG